MDVSTVNITSRFTISMVALITPRLMAPCAIGTLTSCSRSGHMRRLTNIARAMRHQACVTPSCLRLSPRQAASMGVCFGCYSSLLTERLHFPSRPRARQLMSNLMFTAGVGVGISGACGLPLVWRARKPLPCALRSSAAFALGLERRRATVPENRLPFLGLCLRPHWLSPCFSFLCLCSFCLCV